MVGDLGGGFGMKTGLGTEDAVVCYAARKLGRPVKWRAERSEEFLAAHMGRDQHYEAELALDRDGRILALRTRVTANFGADAGGLDRDHSPHARAQGRRPPSTTCPRSISTCAACSPTPWRPGPTAAPGGPRPIT